MRKTIYNRIIRDFDDEVLDVSNSVGILSGVVGAASPVRPNPLYYKIRNVLDFIFINTPKYDEFSEEETPTFRNNS
jgi:hypothetical protein